MSARVLEREDAAAVRTAIARTASRGRGSTVELTDPDAERLLALAVEEAAAAGWVVVEAGAPDPLRDVVRRLAAWRPDVLEGTGRPLRPLLAGPSGSDAPAAPAAPPDRPDPHDPHDLAFALLTALDRLDQPTLVAVRGDAPVDATAGATLRALSGLLPRTRAVLVHAATTIGAAPAGEPAGAAGLPATAARHLGCPPRLAEGEAAWSRAVEDARGRASSRDFGLASGWRGVVRSRAGVVADALPDLLAALRHGADVDPLRRGLLLTAVVDCRLATGDLHRASRHRRDLAALAAGPGPAAALGRYGLAELAAAAGDHGAAHAAYLAAGELLAGAPDPEPPPAAAPVALPVPLPVSLPASWRRGAAVAALHLGRPAEARRLAVADLDRARDCGSADWSAQALRTLAAIDLGAAGTAMLEEAATVLTDSWAPRLAAQVATDLAGQLVLTGGDTDRAVALLRSAESFAAQQRLSPLLHRVQRVLHHLGATPVAVRPGRVAGLGVLEHQVATLVAGGLTEDDVADHLLVTRGEARAALREALRLLGLRSTARLATVLAG